nr:MAG: hypothetical protein 1 [Tombusviridae sp.]
MEKASHARCKTRKPKQGAVGPQGAAPAGLNAGNNCGPKKPRGAVRPQGTTPAKAGSNCGQPPGKRSGNAACRPPQQGLASKHRWSRADLSRASRRDLELRVLSLQSDLENLRRLRKSGQISTAKSDGAIKPGKTEKPSSVNGGRAGFPRVSSEPSIRRSAKSKTGTLASTAPAVTHVRTTPQQSSTASHPGQSRRSTASFATVVNNTPPPPVSEDKGAVHKRHLPQCFGASTVATRAAGPTIMSEDAIFRPQRVPKYTRRPTREEVKGSRNDEFVFADASLSAHLERLFLFEQRDNKLLRKMKLAADKWFRNFDTSETSDEELTKVIVDSITYAIRPNSRLVLLRNSLKNKDTLHEMDKHNSFVEEGKLKSSWSESGKTMLAKINPLTPGKMSLPKATK